MSIIDITATHETDSALITSVRRGDTAAYTQLYSRHVASAYKLAHRLTRFRANADDLVSEAFAKVLGALLSGRGPDSEFRAYLLTALRRTAYDTTRANRKITLTDDVETAGAVRAESVSVAFTDTALARLERTLAAQAFHRLPHRWQTVLRHTVIQGHAPADVASILDLRPNSVSALAYRARQGLRAAYLQAQLRNSDVDRRCQPTFSLLGAWASDNPVSRSKRTPIDDHLAHCDSCRTRVRELADTNPTLVLQCA